MFAVTHTASLGITSLSGNLLWLPEHISGWLVPSRKRLAWPNQTYYVAGFVV
ncbi:hypothetical protein SAMN06309944_0603 [Micrococcales bacterium KH10]|nr:hypothetical protein SAMN06309944_0603 [Micrococcales bacterium KH10]